MTPLEPYYALDASEPPAAPGPHPVIGVLDNIRSAYNVGAMFRTADAGGLAHLHLCGMTAHPPHKKIEKTALGAFAYVPWTYHERTGDCLDALRAAGAPIVGVEVAEGAVAHLDFDWPESVAVVFGNEVTGIAERNLRKCDALVRIPMFGYKNSINVATAFGVIVYDILGKRLRAARGA